MSAEQKYFSISEVADRYGIAPTVLSNLFYRRQLNDAVCPRIAGRRAIPESYLFALECALRRAGHLKSAPDQH